MFKLAYCDKIADTIKKALRQVDLHATDDTEHAETAEENQYSSRPSATAGE